jgi:nitrite reductase/ring-hydroxylating ferredoxin subunit
MSREDYVSGWYRVCRVHEVEEDSPFGAKINNMSIAIFRVGSQCYAVSNICPHEYALLSKGYQEGHIIECPLHLAKFDVRTGKCLGGPATTDLQRYDLKIEHDDILINLPVNLTSVPHSAS